MAVWLVRAGSGGEHENLCLEEGISVVGWHELPDLSEHVEAKEELLELCLQTYPDKKPNAVKNWVNQIWTFYNRIQKGDIIALPLKNQPAIALGEVISDYVYREDLPEDARHARQVKWLQTDIPRTAFGSDLLYSLGAFLTVCRIQRNDAEARIRGILRGEPDAAPVEEPEEDVTDAETVPQDLEGYARDLIRKKIGQRFKEYRFERLIEELLQAQGYQTERTSKGADGGVDIVAGQGRIGFDTPRLAVQVKSGESPEDIRTVRELQGVLKNFGAELGLLVSWGGFRESVVKLKRQLFFEIRLWDADDVIEAIFNNYEQLPDDIRAELPLKRIWTLVPEEV